MPIYEYQCQACGELLEVLQKMSDAPLLECPVCKKPELQKKVSAAGFRLKGSGWYETDFKKDKKRNIAQSGNDAGKSADKSKAEPKAEPKTSKPAEKSKKAAGE
ncbi:MAG: zinc ribbon domain-containing protein [Gammaproteobacteria bacterium]|nr:zinc ribbon domain-containing protein [Gammaproteobacteria bacterium]